MVIAHFLGEPSTPITIRGETVQPSQMIRGIEAEIQRRGGPTSDYFDLWITELVPALAADRFEDSRFRRAALAETHPDETRYGPAGGTPGWVSFSPAQFEFKTGTTNLASYAEWDKCHSPDFVWNIAVDGDNDIALDITSTPSLLGNSSWVSDWSLENWYDIATPSLSGSKLLMGYGPGTAGGVDTTFSGVAYWNY